MWRLFKKIYFWFKSRNMITHYQSELNSILLLLNSNSTYMNKGFSCIDSKSQLGYELYFKYLGGNIDFKILYYNKNVSIYVLPPTINFNNELHIVSNEFRNFSSEMTDLNLIISNTKSDILNKFQILLNSKNIPI